MKSDGFYSSKGNMEYLPRSKAGMLDYRHAIVLNRLPTSLNMICKAYF